MVIEYTCFDITLNALMQHVEPRVEKAVMIIIYRYPIFPTKEVKQRLLASLDTCRWLYNRLQDNLDKDHEWVCNQRADFLPKLSRMYANGYDVIWR
jgi:hypothetical protein